MPARRKSMATPCSCSRPFRTRCSRWTFGSRRPAKWRYAPNADGAAEGLACCDTINMGPVVANGRVFLNTLDGHTIALDASSGSVVWDTTTAGVASGETLTGSPLVVDGKVFIGNSGDDYGARGWIAALDAATGRELWRRYSTGSDGDVGIGLAFHPFYADSRGADRGEVTWTSSSWEHGGGSVSGPIVYDPELHLLLHGTGHPAPWNPDQHGGDNKWTSGLFARDPDTGAARWFDQLARTTCSPWAAPARFYRLIVTGVGRRASC